MGYRLINPYTIYFISFTFGLLLYAFHWSGYFPPLEPPLLTFLCISFCVCLSIAWFIYKKNRPFITIAPTPATKQIATITLINYILWMIEFIYAGGIPLLFILFGKSFNYRTFGVPTLHVFVVTFSSFYTSYLFHAFLASRKRIILF